VDSVTILRTLWRSRVLVAVVAVVAVLASCALAFDPVPPKTKGYTVGIATARILIDTPRSQVVEVEPKGSETLGSRASVLANLMIDGQLEADIAKRAGLNPKKLIAVTQAAGGPETAPTLSRDSFSLTTGVLMNSDLAQLPIIKIETQAPTPQQAAKLANASVEALSDYLDQKAATENIADARRLRVSGLGPAEVREAQRGPGMMMGLGIAIIVFVAGCTGILMLTALKRSWREAVAREQDEAASMVGGDFGELSEFLDDEYEPPVAEPAKKARLRA
jgi:capsular polysaccharide biosynthesis protein